MAIVVNLTRDEMIFAAQGGVTRNIDAILKGRRTIFGNAQRELWANNMIGALAECAVAKAFGRYWTPLYDRPTGVADVGSRTQVRSSINPSASLRIYGRDDGRHAYILVIVNAPVFTLVGWLWGREARRDEWLVTTNETESTWAAPQSALRSLDGARRPAGQR